MEYTKKHAELRSLFSPDRKEIDIPGSGSRIFNPEFHSGSSLDSYLNSHDLQIKENVSFTYPVFAPPQPSSRAILLFHGLNERSWLKYLSWAYYLTELTGSYVILFPISFHMNRGPSQWKDPRAMLKVMSESEPYPVSELTSFMNVALSRRLTEDPMRFFFSGYRTILDITDLATTIKSGNHPVLPAISQIDIFAYSIGAFMSEIMMMGNPGNLFSDSKLFIFCGGSVFSTMKGASKLIMDKRAFERVYDYYLESFEPAITRTNPLYEFFSSHPLGISFRAMIDFSRFRQFRENLFRKLQEQVHSIALRKDTVIPASGITSTLNEPVKRNLAEVWDFPFEYCHENPFPVGNDKLSNLVDSCFERVFIKAAEFLSV